jgi:hypothetical protein
MAKNDTVLTSNLLTIADLVAPPSITPLEIPELTKDGKPGVVHIRPLLAGDVMDIVTQSDGKADSNAVMRMVAYALVHPDGTPMLSGSDAVLQLRAVPQTVFSRISAAVTGTIATTPETGKVSEATTGDASPTV